MKTIILIFILISSYGFPALVFGEHQVAVTVEYIEPIEQECEEGGIPPCLLDDLAGTKIFLDMVTDKIGGTVTDVPATNKTGGGKISRSFCLKIIDDITVKTIEVQTSAYDTSGNESSKTAKIKLPIGDARDCPTTDRTPPFPPWRISLQCPHE